MNEDVEVVHYAITAMVELSKEYDYRLQKIEKKYTNDPDDPVILEEYCDFLKEYLSQGFMEKQMEQIYRFNRRLLSFIKVDLISSRVWKKMILAVKTAGTKGESPYLCLPDGKSYGAKGFFSGRKNIENHGSELAQR